MNLDAIVAKGFDTTFSVTCRMCGCVNFVSLVESDFESWRNGELIQNALPYLNANDRELLQTQICSTCFDTMFSDESIRENRI
jgi:hypothetical protein